MRNCVSQNDKTKDGESSAQSREFGKQILQKGSHPFLFSVCLKTVFRGEKMYQQRPLCLSTGMFPSLANADLLASKRSVSKEVAYM